MDRPGTPTRNKTTTLGTIALVVALLGLLVAASWFAVRSWTAVEGPPMPEVGYAAMTIQATTTADQPIQIADQGEANPEELQRIRKALAELPAVEVKSMEDTPRRVAFVPHAALVGWISEKEILIVEDHLLVAYTVGTGARRRSSVRVEDAGRVFLR